MFAGFVYLGVPIVLLILGVPVFLVILSSATLALFTMTDFPVSSLHTTMFGSIDSVPLLSVPLFIFAGELMGQGGIARRLVQWVLSIIGGVRGSLAYATLVSSELFGTMSGSSLGTVAAVGRLLFPTLKKNGYSPVFAASLISSAGSIAIIIPPSIAMIIYSIAAQQSLVKLFIAGVVPALLIGAIVSIYIFVHARMEMIPLLAKARWSNIWSTTISAIWSLVAPVFILGGIYGGVCTPTEAAGMACAYAIFVSRFVYRELTWRQIWGIGRSSILLVGQLMVIIAAAGIYAWLVTTSGFPETLVNLIVNWGLSPIELMVVLNIIMLVMGSVLEPPAAILMLTPLILPLVQNAGIDPIHFGIVMMVNLAVGMFLPPFGMNLFAAHAIFKVPMGALYRGSSPFLALYLFALVLIAYVPRLSLSAVWLVYGK